MTKPANRLLTLILLLQRQPNQKAADLADSLGVSVRTLHRYIELLDEMGIPVYTERGPCGGFSLVRGYKMPPLVFTAEEATAVSLGTGLVEEMWGDLYREAAHAALAKLENLLPEQHREEVKWARRTLVTAGVANPGLDAQAATLETLRRAIKQSHRVNMVYQSFSSPSPSPRKLEPYVIVFQRGWWYVVGYCHSRQEVRTFRVDRILELSILDETFQAPVNFDARSFMDQAFRGQPQVLAHLRFSAKAARIARTNRTFWDSFEEQADGSVVVTISAPDINWAASTILAYGPVVEVLDPPGLRQLLKEWAQEIFKLYSKEGD
jgi:predicted DNA-binding transcriptional regulator YafY